jgi:hypothetical protein
VWSRVPGDSGKDVKIENHFTKDGKDLVEASGTMIPASTVGLSFILFCAAENNLYNPDNDLKILLYKAK